MAFRCLLLLICALLCVSAPRAQDYIFNRLSTNDGLLSNNILCLWQDPAGYLWLGSERGLQRYDGFAFRTILANRVDQIVADCSKRVWIRSGKTISSFDPVSFSVRNIPFENREPGLDAGLFRLNKDASGRVFLVINGRSFQYFDETSQTFNLRGNPFTLPDSVRIINVIRDPEKQRYWIAAYNGLGYWDSKTGKYYTTAYNPQKDPLLASGKLPTLIAHFFIDPFNRYWIQGWDKSATSFLCFDGRNNQFTGDTAGLANAGNGSYYEIYDFTRYADSTTIVYGLNCLRIREGKSFRELRDPRNNPFGIYFNTVSAVLEDREALLWFATDNGLYYTSGNRFKNIHLILSQDKTRGTFNRVFQDSRQRLWVGTWGRGVFLMDPREDADPGIVPVEVGHLQDHFTRMAWSVTEDKHSGNIWFGCQEGRLMVWNARTQKVSLHRPAMLRNSTIRQMLTDSNGAIWMGLQNGDLFAWRQPASGQMDSGFRKVASFGGYITRMVAAEGGKLWIAVQSKGVYCLDSRSEKMLQAYETGRHGGNIAGVKDLLVWNDSTLLLASDTTAMLNTRTGKIMLPAALEHSGAGPSMTLQKDKFGNCWIGTIRGIFKFNPQTNIVTRYSQRDGLITIHNNSYIPETSFRLTDNRLVFAGNQHLIIFDPAQYGADEIPPDVIITGFQLNQQYLRADSLQQLPVINIPFHYGALTIEFAALSFMQQDKLTYEYQLEGLEDGWTTIKTTQSVQYNFLPHGRYRFLVRTKNEAGQYSHSTTALQLHIVPPFWKTLWFYALIALFTGALLFYLHRLRLHRLLQIEKVRSRLARDLHDDMGSTLSTINILSNIALQQTPLDERSGKEYMSTINSSTTQMMEAMDDIVWSINPVNDHMGKVLARMKEIAGAILEPQHIDYLFEADPAVMELHISMEGRREIFLIFKEALNNIIKYASCTIVTFQLQKQANRLQVTISDNGKGFAAAGGATVTRGNGLRNMRQRAEQAGGSLAIVSAPGKGTRIILTVPLA
ncbi:ligand-binding sensor domain-containing protein [Flavihumibacter petaseus]|uniref:Putative two-component histidine kinase n=1 Tax=Flavihumibacter petaseus NBRC 106054 TaxID=1220578 RepID=A0A0E9MYR3_9BACT|nr:sensor histidine kinase [Flavihumibacter petaseus]GAO42663.1 putative two-component histidine kinase [Flavihumibacter petaseus NBRC 106054]